MRDASWARGHHAARLRRRGHVRLRARQSLRRRSDRHDGSRVAAPPPVPQACGMAQLARQGGVVRRCPQLDGRPRQRRAQRRAEAAARRDGALRVGGDAPGRRARVRVHRAHRSGKRGGRRGEDRLGRGGDRLRRAGRPVRLRLRLLWKGGRRAWPTSSKATPWR